MLIILSDLVVLLLLLRHDGDHALQVQVARVRGRRQVRVGGARVAPEVRRGAGGDAGQVQRGERLREGLAGVAVVAVQKVGGGGDVVRVLVVVGGRRLVVRSGEGVDLRGGDCERT